MGFSGMQWLSGLGILLWIIALFVGIILWIFVGFAFWGLWGL